MTTDRRLALFAISSLPIALAHCANVVTGSPTTTTPLAVTPDEVFAPRPVAPASLSTVGTRQVTFRWRLQPGTDGARIEVCRDRGCSDALLTRDVAGSSLSADVELPSGTLYWRLTGRAGSITGTTTSQTFSFRVGSHASPRTPLDVNGDGFVDLVASDEGTSTSPPAVYVFLGSAAGPSQTPAIVLHGADGEQFGTTLANAGDVNGDGYADLAVAASLPTSVGGRVYLYFGGPSGIDPTTTTVIEQPVARALFGASVAGVGDVDGDGFADVLIGAPNALGEAGQAYLYGGRSTGLASTPIHSFLGRGGHFGQPIVTGDFDGDATPDFAIGSAYTGEVRVYSGGAEPPVVLMGPGPFGWIMSGGDFNGDGFDDIVLGSMPGALVFFGSRTGLPTNATNASQTLYFGSNATRVAGLGDTNGDGFDDALLEELILEGSAAGIASMARTTSPIVAGTPAAGVGDTNGDGFADVAFPSTEPLGLDVHLGSPQGILSDALAPGTGNNVVIAPPVDGSRFPVALAAQ